MVLNRGRVVADIESTAMPVADLRSRYQAEIGAARGVALHAPTGPDR